MTSALPCPITGSEDRRALLGTAVMALVRPFVPAEAEIAHAVRAVDRALVDR